jgi:type II secretion system protein H
MTRNDRAHDDALAFTLVELVLVMALLATIMAIAAPSLGRSLRGRNLDQEAKRFIAATEFARSEAVSQGVPMTVWLDAQGGSFGVEAKAGYPAGKKIQKRWQLNPDVHFELGNTAASAESTLNAVELAPDGTPEPSSIASVRLVDRFNAVVAIAKTRDGWGYEIVKGEAQEK